MWAFRFAYGMVAAMWGVTKFITVIIFSLMVFQAAFAAPEPAAQSTDAIVQQVEDYFNSLSTYQANFRQVDVAQGLVQEGVFYLNRPKKFLWQYETPQRQKIVSTGSRMFYVDEESNQVTQMPLSIGLAAVLTQPQLDLKNGGDLKLLNSTSDANNMSLTFALPEEDGLQAGSITLQLQRQPLALNRLVTTTPLGQQMVVEFYDIRQGQPLAANLFNYIPPQEEIQFIN